MVRDKTLQLAHGSCLLLIHIWVSLDYADIQFPKLSHLIIRSYCTASMNACQLRWPQCSVLALSFMNLFKIYCHWLFCDYSCKEWKISGLHLWGNRLIKEFLVLLIVDIQMRLVSFSWLFSAFMLHLAQLIPIYRGIQKEEVTGSHCCEEWRL